MKRTLTTTLIWLAGFGTLALGGCDLIGGNDAPEFTTTPDTVAVAGTEYVYTARVVDDGGDDVDLTMVTAPLWLNSESVTDRELILRGTPARRHAGQTHNVELRATDGNETVLQQFSVRVGYDFAGDYQASSFTFYREGCGETYDALTAGGYVAMSFDAFGQFEGTWDPGLHAEPVSTPSFGGTYTVSNDVVTLRGIDSELLASLWNNAEFRIEPPRIRQVSTIECGARLTLERSEVTLESVEGLK